MAVSHQPISILGSRTGASQKLSTDIYAAVIDSIDWSRLWIEASGEHARRCEYDQEHADRDEREHTWQQATCADCVRTVLLEIRPGRYANSVSIDPKEPA